MELLLNLAWLLLAVPAYWLWRGSRNARTQSNISSLHCIVALGCLLFMLFPVISATDDLVAMRTEMEESPAGKRSMKQAATDKLSVGKTRIQSPPALPGALAAVACTGECRLLPPISSFPVHPERRSLRAGRSPPVLHVA